MNLTPSCCCVCECLRPDKAMREEGLACSQVMPLKADGSRCQSGKCSNPFPRALRRAE